MHTATTPHTARHAARHEMWIESRARANSGWIAAPRHAYPKRATLRACAPTCERSPLAARIVRALAFKPRYGAHGVTTGGN